MTIEIKELVIRAIVDEGHTTPEPSDFERAELIEQCVQEVLRVLRRSGER